MASIVPSASPALIAAMSAAVRSGGLTLNTGVVPGEQLVGEREVVRRGLGGDRQPVGLGGADQLDAAAPSTGAAGGSRAPVSRRQLDVAVDHQLLGDRRPAGQAEVAAARALVHHRALGEAGDLAVLGQG